MWVKNCPFCGSNKIEYSTKAIGNMKWKTAMYCKKCNAYGPRVIIKVEYPDSVDNIRDDKYKHFAVDKWNERINE